jgi:hypothetical protein
MSLEKKGPVLYHPLRPAKPVKPGLTNHDNMRVGDSKQQLRMQL